MSKPKRKMFYSADDVRQHFFPRWWAEKHPPKKAGTGFAEDFLRRFRAALKPRRR